MRAIAGSLAVILMGFSAGIATSADGLAVRETGDAWSRWQGRVGVGVAPADLPAADLAHIGDPQGVRLGSMSLMGDYFFARRGLFGMTGGFRATSGVFHGARSPLWAGTPSATGATLRGGFGFDRQTVAADGLDGGTVPYLGVGYTGLSAKQRWSVSADVGLFAVNPSSAVKLGRVVSGTQNFDDFVRELRIAPVVQLGVSYAF